MLALCAFPTHASQGSPHIARYLDNTRAAISFTFDDGIRDHATMAVPWLEEHGFRGTFFVVSGYTRDTREQAEDIDDGRMGGVSWEEWKEIASRGHEIGNHSWSHPNLRSANPAKRHKQINVSYDTILSKTGVPPFSFCYPFNARDESVERIVYERHYAARTYQQGYGRDDTPEVMRRMAENGISQGKWMVAMLHGIADGFAHFEEPSAFRTHLQWLATQRDRIWVAPFRDISKYVQLRDAAELTVHSASPSSIEFTLRSTLSPETFDHPLTVVIPVPGASNPQARSKQKGSDLDVVASGNELLVHAHPSDMRVVVEWTNQVVTIDMPLTISRSRSPHASSHETLYNLMGRRVGVSLLRSHQDIRTEKLLVTPHGKINTLLTD